MATGEVGREQVLDAVRVLILVHEDIPEAARVAVPHPGVLVEQLEGLQQEVVEVQGVLGRQPLGVGRLDLGEHLVLHPRTVVHHQGLPGVRRAVLLVGDPATQDRRAEALGVVPQVLHDLLDQRVALGGVVDAEVPRVRRQVLDVTPQDAGAHGVEGADPGSGELRQEAVHPLAHLRGGLVREGDGQDLVGTHPLLGDEPGNAARDNARLAGPRPRQDQERALGVGHGLGLGLVQAPEQVVGAPAHRLGSRLSGLCVHPVHGRRSLLGAAGGHDRIEGSIREDDSAPRGGPQARKHEHQGHESR